MRDGLAVVPDIDRVGFYQVSWQGAQAGTLIVPANLVSAAESDLTPKPIAADRSREGRRRSAQRRRAGPTRTASGRGCSRSSRSRSSSSTSGISRAIRASLRRSPSPPEALARSRPKGRPRDPDRGAPVLAVDRARRRRDRVRLLDALRRSRAGLGKRPVLLAGMIARRAARRSTSASPGPAFSRTSTSASRGRGAPLARARGDVVHRRSASACDRTGKARGARVSAISTS